MILFQEKSFFFYSTSHFLLQFLINRKTRKKQRKKKKKEILCLFLSSKPTFLVFPYQIALILDEKKKDIFISYLSSIAHQAQDWKIMQVINNKIRDDIVKKYAQYTKRVNGEMIKGM